MRKRYYSKDNIPGLPPSGIKPRVSGRPKYLRGGIVPVSARGIISLQASGAMKKRKSASKKKTMIKRKRRTGGSFWSVLGDVFKGIAIPVGKAFLSNWLSKKGFGISGGAAFSDVKKIAEKVLSPAQKIQLLTDIKKATPTLKKKS